jgi:hypothetical protein
LFHHLGVGDGELVGLLNGDGRAPHVIGHLSHRIALRTAASYNAAADDQGSQHKEKPGTFMEHKMISSLRH